MLIYGKKIIVELCATKPHMFITIFLNRDDNEDVYALARKHGIRVEEFTQSKYFYSNNIKNHQNVCAQIKNFEYESLNDALEKNTTNAKNIILLDTIESPHNLGAIIRNATAFDVAAVIINKSNSSPINSTVIKSSSGSVFEIPIVFTNLNSAIKRLKEHNYLVVSTSLNTHTDYKKLAEMNKPFAIIFGNESKGVRKSLQMKSDMLVKISISNKIQSLNVSSTSAIMLNYLKEI